MLGSLLPQPRIGPALAWRRWGFGVGPRLVMYLLLGLLWLLPAWWDRRAVYGLLAWDALLLGAFLWDLKTLRRARPEVSRIWDAAPALSTPAEIRIELRNLGTMFHVRAQDDIPPSLRRAGTGSPTSSERHAAARQNDLPPSENNRRRSRAAHGATGVFVRGRAPVPAQRPCVVPRIRGDGGWRGALARSCRFLAGLSIVRRPSAE